MSKCLPPTGTKSGTKRDQVGIKSALCRHQVGAKSLGAAPVWCVVRKTSTATKPGSNFYRRPLSTFRNTPRSRAFAVYQDRRGEGGLSSRSPASPLDETVRDQPFTNNRCSLPALREREQKTRAEGRRARRGVISRSSLESKSEAVRGRGRRKTPRTLAKKDESPEGDTFEAFCKPKRASVSTGFFWLRIPPPSPTRSPESNSLRNHSQERTEALSVVTSCSENEDPLLKSSHVR